MIGAESEIMWILDMIPGADGENVWILDVIPDAASRSTDGSGNDSGASSKWHIEWFVRVEGSYGVQTSRASGPSDWSRKD